MASSSQIPAVDQQDWGAVAKQIVDGVFDAVDPDAAVDHILAMLGPVETYGNVMSLGRELSSLRSEYTDADRQVACSAIAGRLYRSAIPMPSPLAAFAGAALAPIAALLALVASQPLVALAFALLLAASLGRIGLFRVRMRRADLNAPAQLPDRSQLLTIRAVRERGRTDSS